MKIAGTRIIPQPLPILHHLVLIRSSQSLYIGKTLDKAKKIIIPLRHPRLLKNNLRNPDQIRIGRLPPGQFTFILFIPLYNRFRKLVHILIPNVLSNIYLVYPTQKAHKSNSFSSKKTLCHYFFRKMCRIYFFRSLKSYIFAVQKISNNIVIIFFLRKND